MAFHNLAPQTPLSSEAALDYGQEALRRSSIVAQSLPTRLDVAYGDHPQKQLDIYYPPGRRPNDLPALIFLHGGGWSHGYKEWAGFMAAPVVRLPAIFVSVDYRLAPEHKFPAPLDDTITAVRWVHDNAATIGVSKERLFIGGHSAGGHLAALACLRTDALLSAGLPGDALKGCFPVSGVFDFRGRMNAADSRERKAAEKLLASADDGPAASPILYAAPASPPFLLAYGSRDYDWIIRSNRQMETALQEQGVAVQSMILEDHDHFESHLVLGEHDHRWVQAVAKAMGITARNKADIAAP